MIVVSSRTLSTTDKEAKDGAEQRLQRRELRYNKYVDVAT